MVKTKMTPSDAAIKTLENLAKLGKIEVFRQGKLFSVRFQGRFKAELVQFQAVEQTFMDAILAIGRQAAGRIKK